MKSPFPGMDPYLEAHWPDVHSSLVGNARNAIQSQLTGPLRARIGERLVIEEDFTPMRSIYPDIRVFEHGVGSLAVLPAPQGVVVAEPLVAKRKRERVRQTFVQIIDIASGGRLVTVIEFLSPSNKFPGDGQKQYKKKQEEVLDADINLVEIDLTRGGERDMVHSAANLPEDFRTTYIACISRGFGSEHCEIYRMPLRARLPAIRIPVRRDDPDAILDIQPLVEQAYVEGRYDDIDYAKPCIPPLTGEDATWAEGLLKEAKKQ